MEVGLCEYEHKQQSFGQQKIDEQPLQIGPFVLKVTDQLEISPNGRVHL